MNRKGVSAVVANVLIILLVVVGVALIWAAVRPSIENATNEIDSDCFTVNVEPVSCTYAYGAFGVSSFNNAEINVTVKRNPGRGEIKALKLLVNGAVYDYSAFPNSVLLGTNDYVFEEPFNGLNELGSQVYTVDASEILTKLGGPQIGFFPVNTVNVVPVVGNDKLCPVLTKPIKCSCDNAGTGIVDPVILASLCP